MADFFLSLLENRVFCWLVPVNSQICVRTVLYWITLLNECRHLIKITGADSLYLAKICGWFNNLCVCWCFHTIYCVCVCDCVYSVPWRRVYNCCNCLINCAAIWRDTKTANDWFCSLSSPPLSPYLLSWGWSYCSDPALSLMICTFIYHLTIHKLHWKYLSWGKATHASANFSLTLCSLFYLNCTNVVSVTVFFFTVFLC